MDLQSDGRHLQSLEDNTLVQTEHDQLMSRYCIQEENKKKQIESIVSKCFHLL